MLRTKHIAHVVGDGSCHIGFCPNIDGMEVAKGTEVVQSCHMIEMFVREQHRFYARHGIVKARSFV